MGDQPERPAPALRVVSGSPTPEELAVVTALLAAAAAGGDAPERPGGAAVRGTWSDPARHARRPLRPGPNAWRASAW